MMCSVDVPLFGFFPLISFSTSQRTKKLNCVSVYFQLSPTIQRQAFFLKQDADYEGILAEFSIFIKLVQQTHVRFL